VLMGHLSFLAQRIIKDTVRYAVEMVRITSVLSP